MIYLEIAELVENPIRTGIQRVVRELIRRASLMGTVRLCAFDRDIGYPRLLPDSVIPLLCDETPAIRALSPAALADRIRNIAPRRDQDYVRDFAVPIFVPELFFEPLRANYHQWRVGHEPGKSFFLAYDFIPWLHPDHIGVVNAAPLMPYLRLLKSARHVSFISDQTRRDFAQRIVRREGDVGPVIPLGADALDIERQSFSPARRDFLCIGSIDGRKNQDVILRAFRGLWREGFDMSLTFAGRVFDETSDVAADVRAAAGDEPLFRHIDGASDDALKQLMRGARATIYASEIEGYGLPPVEGLRAGIPAIVGAGLPSMAMLPERGFVRLTAMDENAMAAAVRRLADDSVSASLWADAAGADLPVWDDTARAIRAWMSA